MSRIRFEDTTPINKGNLDKLNNVIISPTEPTTGEEVWIDNINKKIYTKNDNDIYEKIYSETTPTSETLSAATFYKVGNLVIVQGWLVINSTSATFTAPYKPIGRTLVSSVGLDTKIEPSYIGMIDLLPDGTIIAKYKGASTYGTTGFCYYTND